MRLEAILRAAELGEYVNAAVLLDGGGGLEAVRGDGAEHAAVECGGQGFLGLREVLGGSGFVCGGGERAVGEVQVVALVVVNGVPSLAGSNTVPQFHEKWL